MREVYIMLGDLKKKSLISAIKRAIVCLLIAGAIGYFGGFDALQFITGPKKMDVQNIEDYVGEYVTIDINYMGGSYARTEPRSGGADTSREYIVTDYEGYDEVLFGLYLDNGDYQKFENWYESSWEDDWDEALETEDFGAIDPYVATGMLVPMDSESEDIFMEVLEKNDFYTETGRLYYLKVGYLGANTQGFTLFMGALCLFFIFMAIYPIVKALTGGYQKGIRKFASASGSQEFTLQEMEAWYPQGVQIGCVRFGPQFVILQEGATSNAVFAQDLVWAYQKTTRTNGVNSGYSLMLGTINGKLQTLAMSSRKVAESLQFITQNYPQVALGYNGENQRIFRSNAPALRELAMHQRQGTAGATLTARPPVMQAAPPPFAQQAPTMPVTPVAPVPPMPPQPGEMPPTNPPTAPQ